MDDVSPPPPRRARALLPLILAAGLALRLLPLLCHGQHAGLFMDPDSWGYDALARNLLAGHGYSWDAAPPYAPNFYRLPGFPLLLCGLYALTGPSVAAGIALQALVGTASIWLVYRLARRLAVPPGGALTAAAVQALDPVAVFYGNQLLTETYTSFVLLLIAGCLLRYRASGRAGWLPAAGGLFAVGIYFHPVLLFLPLLLPAVPLLARPTRTRRQVGVALASAALALAPAAAWVVRNAVVGDFRGISSVTSVNMLKYKAAGVEAELRGTSREVERDRLTRECEAELPPGATPGDRFRLWQRRGADILLAHPRTYAKVHARGMALEVLGPERDLATRFLYGGAVLDATGRVTDAGVAAARADRPRPALDAVRYLILGWQGLLGLGLVAGAWQTASRRPALLLTLLLLPVYVLALSGGPEASPRFRVLYLPVMSLLTAVGIQAVLSLWPSPRRAASPARLFIYPAGRRRRPDASPVTDPVGGRTDAN